MLKTFNMETQIQWRFKCIYLLRQEKIKVRK